MGTCPGRIVARQAAHPGPKVEITPATVDRLLHHAHVCQTSGESVRLSQAVAGQGVTPLTGPPTTDQE
ncbi:MAG TPA: hypothetical protein VIU87_13900 [Mycobacterium sp.]